MIEFARTWAFAALPLPLLAWFVFPPLGLRRALSIPLGLAAMMRAVSQENARSGFARTSGIWVLTLGWFALICALAGPQMRAGDLLQPSGRDVVVAVDLSASMATQDMPAVGEGAEDNLVERMELMRDMVGRFIEGRSGDRLALIGFATDAFLIVPLTYDAGAVSQTLHELRVGLPGRKTDLGRAIGLAVQTLKDAPADDRLLAILTDGQTNAGGLSALDAADLAASANIRIHMIGFAAEIEPENAEHMREIAERTGGRYHAATSADALERAYADIDAEATPRAREAKSYLTRDLSWIPTLVAFVVMCWLGLREVREG